ncbi:MULTISPECIES: PAAR domain-containing protein [Pseudomonas]|uniref:PAAR domain-containing protein n=1 Tax=Pseudomonas TaxID=286 RepID=UPI0018E87541|nr:MULTISPECIES: PAAR domain-containing protein [Pseudomonas]MBJ2347573.1 PAAR domain-containing protein [Pseudomonas canavaninivorans]MBL3543555.1 PAAR domain-containing protein [Pseudomonas sp. HB05]
MSRGYYIGLGDETTCGGKVLDGDASFSLDGLLHACEGDRVTCGKNGKTYRIIGGVTHMTSNGRLMAGTLDSQSGCPCNARLLPSVFTASYRNENPPPRASRAAQPAPQSATYASAAPRHSSFAPSSQLPFGASTHLEPQEPGFYVVPKSVSREALEATLFPAPDPQVMRKFRALNPRRDVVKAGSMIVLSDPNNLQCTREEAQVMAAAETVNAALEDLTAEQADFMHRHAAEIASFTGQTSTWLGVSAVVMEKHLASLRDTLQAMERLHQDSYRQHGHLKSAQFFTERKLLLAQLDAHLLNSTRLRGHTTLGDHPKLKTALGISSRSLVHHWNKAGAPGQIPGYATHVEATSRAAKYMQMGGYVGIGIGGVSSVLAVQAVCNGGSEEACERVRFTEGGKFVGSAVGGWIGGVGASAASGSVCLLLGVTTGIGGVLCVGAVVAAGAWGGTTLGAMGGEGIGEVLYEEILQ